MWKASKNCSHLLLDTLININVLVIEGDLNAQLDKDNNHLFVYHQENNRNGHFLKDFALLKTFLFVLARNSKKNFKAMNT